MEKIFKSVVSISAILMMVFSPFAALTPEITEAAFVGPWFCDGKDNCPSSSCTGLGYQSECKIDGIEDPGDYTENCYGLEATTISYIGEGQFDWTSTFGIDAVVAKGGSGGNVYVYDPPTESFGDTSLVTPINSGNSKPYGLSHVSFCYDTEIPECGDGECNGEETCETCPQDCGECPPICGDQSCNGEETCETCPEDCGECPPECGDGECNGEETCETCPEDCGECPGPESLAIKAYKVICETEEDLPNWGSGGSDITETTASDYVTQSEEKCWLEADWNFEWAYAGTANPGDNIIGPAGGAWTTFGPTNSNGETVTTINSLSGDRIWMREIMQEGYIPFSGSKTAPRDNVSAEMYCHNDVLNYDNYDYILNPQWDNAYYCVAFNVPVEEPQPECGNGVIEEGEDCDDGNNVSGDGCSATCTLEECEPGQTESCKTGEYGVCSAGTKTCNQEGMWGDCVRNTGPSQEICDLCDNDCDGAVDEDLTRPTSNQNGLCSGNIERCLGGQWTEDRNNYQPTEEICDGLDNDCDGEVDEGCACIDGDTQQCGPRTDEGECSFGTQTCVGGEWGTCEGAVYPVTEICDGLDNDCDGQIDEGGVCSSSGPTSGGYAPGQVLGEEIVEPCGLYLYEYIQYGADNNPEEVKKLQVFLNDYMGSNLPITGIYDLATMQVLKQFQVQCKEEVLRPWVEDGGTLCDENQPTGYVYKTTQRWINLIMCPTLNLPMPDLSGYPKADCLAYLGAVLGEEVLTQEDGTTDGVVEDNGEDGEVDEATPTEEEITPLEIGGETETEERGMSTLWFIIIIILVVAALIWFVFKGMKR